MKNSATFHTEIRRAHKFIIAFAVLCVKIEIERRAKRRKTVCV